MEADVFKSQDTDMTPSMGQLRRASAITFADRWRNASAAAAPMPLLAPVIITSGVNAVEVDSGIQVSFLC
jgi:6-pyruvoyltetrahydropterin/6-carboxytetrahydropterin synthase